jgi:hypothetical protein
VDFAKGQLPQGTEKGLYRVPVPATSWVATTSGTQVVYFTDSTRFTRLALQQDVILLGGVPVPPTVAGKRTRLLEVELCYLAVAPNVTLDDVAVAVVRQSTGLTTASFPLSVTDPIDRQGEACRTYGSNTPFLLTADDAVTVSLRVDYAAAGDFFVGRTTAVYDVSTKNG